MLAMPNSKWVVSRTLLFDVSEKMSVREVLQTGGIVAHHIDLSWEEVPHMSISMLVLVVTDVAAQSSSGAVAGDDAFCNGGV